MTILAVDHINVATTRLEETRAFYVDVLGLNEGPRPPFAVAGHWLYAGDRPVVHMQQASSAVGASELSALNHAAFRVVDLGVLLERLDDHGVAYEVFTVPGTEVRQAFFQDPNGVRLEFNETA